MATASDSPFAIGEGNRKNCVVCNTDRPQEGRILHCLHVICVACLDETITNDGCIECAVCDKITKPVYRSFPLRNQLVLSSSVFTHVDSPTPESVTGKLVCDFCETSATKPASHVCSGCDGALLCDLHSGDHSKKRLFRSHTLRALADVNSNGSVEVQQKCPLHIKHELFQFCKTCDLAVCQQCLRKGHNDHQVTSLLEAAEAQRSSMRKAMDIENVVTEDASCPGSAGQPVSMETMKSNLSSEICNINDEVTAASKHIVETFSHIKKLVEKKEAELLHEVDVFRWKQQQPLDKKIQNLADLQAAHEMAVEVATYLTGAQSNTADVMQLGKHVEQKLTSYRSDAESHTKPGGIRAVVRATTVSTVLAKLEEDVKAVMTVSEDFSLDVSQATADVPDRVNIDQVTDVTLSIPSSKLPAMSPGASLDLVKTSVAMTLMSPSGRRLRVPVSQVSGGEDHASIVINATLEPVEQGEYVLEVRCAGQSKTIDFLAVRSMLHFDPERGSTAITLSNSNKVAVYNGKGAGKNHYGTVYGGKAYTEGVHTWSVQVGGDNVASGYIFMGVALLPDRGVISNAEQCAYKYGVGWNCASGAYSLLAGSQDTWRSKWQDGDVLTFTLDCSAKTLEMHVHRTGERVVNRDFNTNGKPLYFCICIWHENMQIEIL